MTFSPGETLRQTVSVRTLDEDPILDEDDETFTLTLSAAVNATIEDGTAEGTILDDDPLDVVGT